MNETRPPFDQKLADDLVGKYVLIGQTLIDSSGNVVGQKQFHGVIRSADATNGFYVDLKGAHDGKVHYLPPDTRAFQKANPGEYRLRTTGEVVTDPDYLSTWTITSSD